MRRKKQTIKANINDVAKKAEVSIKTVSRVVNGEPNVRTTTRDRVLKAVADLNYSPSISARSLAGNRSFLIGLLYDNPSANYVSDLQMGAIAQCHEEGYFLLVEHFDSNSKSITQQIEKLLDQSALDGLILTPPICDLNSVLKSLEQSSVPFVRIAPDLPFDNSVRIYINDYQAAYEITSHLISLGHKDIGFIKGHPDHAAAMQRFDGFRDALKAHNIQILDKFIEQGYFSYSSGMACAEKIFAKEKHPTAIFAADDDMAAGVAATAHKLSIEIPGDLSLAGFDDSPIARVIWPQLTTVRQPLPDMAAAAVKSLIQQINFSNAKQDKLDEFDILLDFEIVIRQSTAAPSSKA